MSSKFNSIPSKDVKKQPEEDDYQAQPQPPPYSTVPVNVPVITQQPTTVVVQSIELGPKSFLITCPQCQNTKATSIDYESSVRTHITAALLCLVGLWPCICIPYCTSLCRDTKHSCSHCGGKIHNSHNSI